MLSDDFIAMRMRRNKPLVIFGNELLAGVRKNLKAIDSLIGKHASNWSIKRMATIDRNILRLATYEMVLGGVPGRVVINEAIELAKRYGHHNSSQFVNGILDRILREAVEKKEPAAPASDTEPNEVVDSAAESS